MIMFIYTKAIIAFGIMTVSFWAMYKWLEAGKWTKT